MEPAIHCDAASPPLLFVYGTLRDPSKVREILGHSCKTIPAVLKDFELRVARWPYVLPSKGSEVEGLVLLNLTTRDLEKLDDYEVVRPVFIEGARRRLYKREATEVVAGDGRLIRCWVYLPKLKDWSPDWR